MRRLLFLCLTERCSIRIFWNRDGNCRGCGERGLPIYPKSPRRNGKPPD